MQVVIVGAGRADLVAQTKVLKGWGGCKSINGYIRCFFFPKLGGDETIFLASLW